MCIIYKATNIKNNKFYIGQTSKTLEERIKKHFNDQKIFPNRKFYQELNEEDFIWEILEENIDKSKVLEVEMAYILSTNAYIDGYNAKNCFENCQKLTKEDIDEIYDMLKHTNISIRNIANIYNVSEAHIGSINVGRKHYSEKFVYPIRNTNKSKKMDISTVMSIKYMLKNTNLKQEEIAAYFNIIRKRVTDINNGKTFFDCNDVYPLRKQKKYSDSYIEDIIYDIKNSHISFEEIAKKYKCNICKISDINNGNCEFIKTYIKEFPIRNVENRIKKDSAVYDELYNILLNTNMKYSEIQKKLNVSKSLIVRFNNGKSNISKEYTIDFPIRKVPLMAEKSY